ncbi:MAG: type V CRISPR-associated protein Cas12b [Verrucomicrobiales bacterium]|nr:type V CRISPR-associated protein Cas12b [Verrucomicrobiales bacterium]
MNRIYFGKVSAVEIPIGRDANSSTSRLLDRWDEKLWQHHELFQDAVNYYTLALAAMAAGLNPDSPKSKAALAWRAQVREAWVQAQRKAVLFAGPHNHLAKWLNVNFKEADPGKAFDACATALLKDCLASTEALAKALLQLIEEADQSDLNQLCVSRLPWLCTPHGKLDATPKNVAQQQEMRMLVAIGEIHEASAGQLPAISKKLELGCFVTQTPKERMTGAEARTEAERLFKSASTKAKGLAAVAERFVKHLDRIGDQLALPRLGRKPKGAYPLAVVFKLFPVPETWEAFKSATVSLRKKADKLKDSPTEIAADFIAEARTEADQPVFDYFTNRVLFCEADNNDRAVWFDFDLAAFIEAIKAPHRYFQDTLTREKAAQALRQKLASMEGRAGDLDDEHDEDDESVGGFGFEGDERINLLRELVTDTLGYVAEAESPGEEAKRIEYTIQERTLRGFEEIKERWRKLAEKGQATQEKLIEALNEQQAKQRDDFGSAALYRALAQPKYHPIWRNPGTQKWHAIDALRAWRAYKELRFELADKERLIRFTPAHPEHSPRYFIIPKQGRLGSDHQPGQLAFTCGMVLKSDRGLQATEVRITYSAPRLRRDELRREGIEDLEAASWLQPMMKALGLPETDQQNFANCRVTLQPEKLKPRKDREERHNVQLTFPVEVNPEKLVAGIGKASLWNRQFNLHPDGDSFYNASLRWPHEKQPSKPPLPWFEQVTSFRTLATDLGQRDAGAFARLVASCKDEFGKKPSRFIGATGGKQWRAALERSGLFRLPGEDALVWREISDRDKLNSEDTGKLFDFREELWGERGRRAREWEADDTADLMRQLEVPTDDEELSLLPMNWRKELSFPEQNDKLLIALRRFQSRISRLHRWCWFLKGDNKQQKSAYEEIAECEDTRLISTEQQTAASKHDARLLDEIESQLRERLKLAPRLLERIANRVLPMRGRSWRWEKHPVATELNPLHHLMQAGPSLDSKERPVWLRGQRGLSLERIEQIEELRKRCQSLNQTLRRLIGGKPPIRRDESVPDPCPDLLKKLDSLKEQRVNQTAHMILAEALGLRLSPPQADKKKLRQEKDQHGVYEKILDKQGRWIGPVDLIVIEDLSRYRATQGRAPRENSRLMKWCHRAVRDKLKQLCEVFGLPVLETPAAYSSRFCSRSGVPGFRAEEVTAGFTQKGQWAWLARKKDEQGIWTPDAQRLRDLDRELTQAQKELEANWTEKKRAGICPKRTLLVPASIGSVFVPVTGEADGADLPPAVVQADINAAINLALRAIADPSVWNVHTRLRTQRDKKDDSLAAREKRKFGEKNPPRLTVTAGERQIADSSVNPNFFADFAGLKQLADSLSQEWLMKEWTSAELRCDKAAPILLLHSKSFWGTVKAAQWKRIEAINTARLTAWRGKLDTVPP